MSDWYQKRNELRCGQVFRTYGDEIVQLDRPVPGDGTKWYVADMWNGSWAYMDSTIEPGDLMGDPLPDPTTGAAR